MSALASERQLEPSPTLRWRMAVLGAVAGLVGFGGAMGGVVFGQAVGYLLDHGVGYGVVFAIAGSLHVLAFAIICVAIPTIRPLGLQGETTTPRRSGRCPVTSRSWTWTRMSRGSA